MFTLGAAIGGLYIVRGRRMSALQLAGIGLLLVYVLIYRGSGNTWNAAGTEPTFDASVMRYWLPFYTALFFLMTYALTSISDGGLKFVFVAALLLSGPMTVYTVAAGSVEGERTKIEGYQRWAETVLVPNTEPDSIIYASRTDKAIASYRDVATWWNGEEFYDPSVVAHSVSRLHESSARPIYVYKEREVSIPELNQKLADFGLEATPVMKTGLYRISELSDERTQEKR